MKDLILEETQERLQSLDLNMMKKFPFFLGLKRGFLDDIVGFFQQPLLKQFEFEMGLSEVLELRCCGSLDF